ncbi:hypothetical protein [Kitasatospora purpeofusca]|uniref:hypothetical protein n=1 Tax=Kitasatospora purpeofusca TaxID=67352 RepID=UPI00381E9AA1
MDADLATDRTEQHGPLERPTLAELAGCDAGDLAGSLELALADVGGQPPASFNSAL